MIIMVSEHSLNLPLVIEANSPSLNTHQCYNSFAILLVLLVAKKWPTSPSITFYDNLSQKKYPSWGTAGDPEVQSRARVTIDQGGARVTLAVVYCILRVACFVLTTHRTGSLLYCIVTCIHSEVEAAVKLQCEHACISVITQAVHSHRLPM